MKDMTPQGNGSEVKKRFRNEKEFVCWIKDNSDIVFCEKMHWRDSPKLPGRQGKDIKPDLMGCDSKGNIVIVEVKYFMPEEEVRAEAHKFSDHKKRSAKISNYRTNKRDTFDKAVGQILRYACAYMTTCVSEDPLKTLRLFVITSEESLDVKGICEFLRGQRIKICYLYVPKETRNGNSRVRQTSD